MHQSIHLKSIQIKGKLMTFKSPKVMGIINLTSDSFYPNSRVQNQDALFNQVQNMIAEGVDVIDIGAYSTRPGHVFVTEADETSKIAMALETLNSIPNLPPISVDTFRSSVAAYALNHGASIINDVSGGLVDQNIFKMCGAHGAPYVLMHMQGSITTHIDNNIYKHMLPDMLAFFIKQIKTARNFGVTDIIIDPGFGFSKNMMQNFFLLNNLAYFNTLNLPILVGISRKSMLYKLLDISVDETLEATQVAHYEALVQGADILRVHDVKAAVHCITLYNTIKKSTI